MRQLVQSFRTLFDLGASRAGEPSEKKAVKVRKKSPSAGQRRPESE